MVLLLEPDGLVILVKVHHFLLRRVKLCKLTLYVVHWPKPCHHLDTLAIDSSKAWRYLRANQALVLKLRLVRKIINLRTWPVPFELDTTHAQMGAIVSQIVVGLWGMVLEVLLRAWFSHAKLSSRISSVSRMAASLSMRSSSHWSFYVTSVLKVDHE